jgi:taurine dioxygenase
MDIKFHDNGWTVIVENIDLKNLTQDQANLIGKYLAEQTVVVFKKQNLSPQDQIQICSLFGKVQNFNGTTYRKSLHLPGGDGYIMRVTGELDEHGQPGLFGHVHELEWHCNRVADPDRMPIVWLYGERGTKGSRTSWLNTIMPYNDSPEDKKQEFEQYRLDVGNNQTFMETYADEVRPDIDCHCPKLIHTGLTGIKGLFFPFNQIHFIVGMDKPHARKLLEDLWNFVEQEKYMYHHDWEDGDVVISEQWHSIHKRWEFDRMDKRVLHRLAMNFDNILL